MKEMNIHISEILDLQRMDVAYYKDNIGIKGFVPLSRYVNIKGGKRIPKGTSFIMEKSNYLYLRLSEISDFENIDFDVLKNISEDLYNTLKRYEIKNNQIVFSIAGTIGKIFVIKNIPTGIRIILTENCAMLQPKSDEILSEYISILLNCDFVQKQIEQNRIQTTIPKIGLDRIGKLKVPKVPLCSIQQKAVEIYRIAQKAKQEKDKEAKSLLDSIDSFLIKILAITQNQSSEQELEFPTTLSNVIGKRLDVSSYKKHFEMISDKYPNKKLSSIAKIDPTIKFHNTDKDISISFIPMECIDEEYGEVNKKYEVPISQTKGYTKFEEGDLLWAKITPCMQNGKSAIARNLKNGKGCGSTEFYVIRPKTNELLIEYVYLVLRHSEVLKAAQGSFGGSAGQQRVSSQYIKSIIIPYPDLNVQQMIVDVVIERKRKAKQLQQEGCALLKKAKHEIEKIILG